MGWNVTCYIMGVISIVGPVCLIFWYVKGAKEQLANLKKTDE